MAFGSWFVSSWLNGVFKFLEQTVELTTHTFYLGGYGSVVVIRE